MTANPLNIDLRALPGPDDIHRVEFDNGLVVLSRANYNSPSVIVSGFLPAGGLFDPPEKLGLADFTAAALLRGVEGRAFQEIYEALESTGARLGIGSGTHSTRFNGKALAEDLDLLLEILGQALRAPVFPPEQIERLRGQLLTGLAIRAQDTGEMASLAFDEIVYANHTYLLPSDGFPETIQAITRADLVDFHQRCYGPRGMVIVIVGGVEPARAVEKAAAVFGDWRNPSQPEPPSLP
ncbi:MAG TPA: pitrilysin family protein, partial [Anaerolineales bacterium]|nr:pitrilysin family protein [Anaerolineales bacterium]